MVSLDLDKQDQDLEPVAPFIYALAEAITSIQSVSLKETERKQALEATAQFVQGEIRSIPILPRGLYEIGMGFFRIFVLLRYFSGFSGLPLEKRCGIVRSWAWGNFGLGRQLFRLVRSTAFLAFYEHPAVKSALGESAGSENLGPVDRK